MLAFLLAVFGVWSWLTESVIQELLLGAIEAKFAVYYPDITGIALTLILVAAALFFASRASYIHEYELLYIDLVRKLKFKFVLLSIGLVLCGAGSSAIYKLYKIAPTADQDMLVIDLDKDDLPSFLQLRKINLKGAALSKRVSFSKDLREASPYKLRRYTPITNSKDSDRPIRFVESFTSDSTSKHKTRRAKLKGYVSLRPLPAAVRAGFESNGLKFESPVYVIEDTLFDIAPYLKWTLFCIALITLMLLIRVLLTPRLHKLKLQAAWDLQNGYSKTKDVSKDVWPWSRLDH